MFIYKRLISLKNKYVSDYDLFGRQIIRKWISEYNWNHNPNILDLGCGQGDDLASFREFYPSSHAVGIDIQGIDSPELKVDNIERRSVNLESTALPFSDSTFDILIANQVFEHLKNWAYVLMESTRVLKPNGILIIGVPNLASLHNRVLLCAGRQPTCIRTGSMHVRGFTLHGLREVLEHAEIFRIRSVAGLGFYPFPARIARSLSSIFPSAAATLYVECVKIGDHRDFQSIEAIDRIAEMSL